LEFAVQRHVPAAAFGQGIGPVTGVALRQRLSDVLPRLTVIGLRERRESVRFLEAIGIDTDRVIVTGDDAIEMASRAARPELGDAVGINVRLAGYAGITTAAIDLIGPAVRRAADRLAAPLVAVPIAHHPDCHDGVAIRQVMRHSDGPTSPIVSLDTPAKAIAAVSRCRVVVTGSYHAAVFALAQGIPVVAMAATRYYVDKFSGLAELFGGGCDVVLIGSAETGADLEAAIVQAWTDAPARRPQLLKAAAVQIECAREAYRRLGSMVGRDRTETQPDRATPRPIAARFEI
jgi:colanic acid/amylovoran biosynthesis protein